MASQRGSEWAIWDLHVHTPASIVQNYGGDTDDVWERYLASLAALPKNIRVLGINDYWFIDGYRRVHEAWARGDLQNIELIVPVVEMRLDILGGTESNLSKQNLHVLFDPELSVDVIESQFLSALTAGFKLSPDIKSGTWGGVITRESLRDLGDAILAAARPEVRAQMGSPLFVGFSNLVMSRDHLLKTLDGPYLKGKTLLALGKSEWSAMRWNQSAALKRDMLETVDLLFTAFDDVERWTSARQSLSDENLSSRLFDCSDAHHWADSAENARLGNCLNWINAGLTFSGLQHALSEFDHRVFVGVSPDHVQSLHRFPDRYIDSISVRPVVPDGEHVTFDYSLPLNSQFVAVVGNKGQGKSALLDCIALAGGSPRRKEFAFLNDRRFLSARSGSEAEGYVATLTWKNGASASVNLGSAREPSTGDVQVEYLPQAFVERVCTARPNSDAARDFESELQKVLFSHIEEEDRAGAASFEELQDKRTGALQVEAKRLRETLAREVEALLGLIKFQRDHPVEGIRSDLARSQAAVQQAETALRAAKDELDAIEASARDEAEIIGRRELADSIEAERSDLVQELARIGVEMATLRGTEMIADALAARIESVNLEIEAINEGLLNEVYTPLSLEPTETPLLKLTEPEDWRAIVTAQRRAEVGRLAARQVLIEAKLQELQEKMSMVSRELAQIDASREASRQQVRDRQAHLDGLRGSEDDPQTMLGLTALMRRREESPGKIADAKKRLIGISQEIHRNLIEVSVEIGELFAPVEQLAENSESLKMTGVRANVSLEADSRLTALEDSLDRRRATPLVPAMSEFPRADMSDWDALEIELRQLLAHTVGTDERPIDPGTHLKSGYSAAAFLTDLLGLKWARQRVELLSGDVPLSTLSPGQRGLVLLLFYLLIDQGRIPLILDQPEENLDNDTVASVVVPALREASKRRQVIVVTHNSNLAVVGDADQVVECRYQDGRFELTSGPISELDTAITAVRVLEGTKPALDNRYGKFRRVPAS